jgi:hypothetical protein
VGGGGGGGGGVNVSNIVCGNTRLIIIMITLSQVHFSKFFYDYLLNELDMYHAKFLTCKIHEYRNSAHAQMKRIIYISILAHKFPKCWPHQHVFLRRRYIAKLFFNNVFPIPI